MENYKMNYNIYWRYKTTEKRVINLNLNKQELLNKISEILDSTTENLLIKIKNVEGCKNE